MFTIGNFQLNSQLGCNILQLKDPSQVMLEKDALAVLQPPERCRQISSFHLLSDNVRFLRRFSVSSEERLPFLVMLSSHPFLVIFSSYAAYFLFLTVYFGFHAVLPFKYFNLNSISIIM